MEDEVKKEHEIVKIQKGITYGDTYISIAYNITWAIAFWAETHQTNSANCQDPVWFWCNFAKYYYTAGATFHLVSLIFLANSFAKGSFWSRFISACIYFSLVTLVRLAGIALLVGMIMAYSNRGVCGDMSTIVTVQFIFIMLILGSLFFACCCGSVTLIIAIATGGISDMMRKVGLEILFEGLGLIPALLLKKNAPREEAPKPMEEHNVEKEHDVEKDHEIALTHEHAVYGETYCEIFYHILWAVVFWVNLNSTNTSECHETVLFWSTFARDFYTVSAVVHFLSLFFLPITFTKLDVTPMAIAAGIFFLIVTLVRLVNVALIVGIMMAFSYRDECLDMYYVITAQYIVILVIIGLLVGIFAFTCFAGYCFYRTGKDFTESTLEQMRPVLETLVPIVRMSHHRHAYSEL